MGMKLLGILLLMGGGCLSLSAQEIRADLEYFGTKGQQNDTQDRSSKMSTVSQPVAQQDSTEERRYDQLIGHALQAARKDSLKLSEHLFKEALRMDPANMRNALLLTNLGTVQRRLGKVEEAIDSYTLSLNITPYSVVTLLNRASLYLSKNLYNKAYLDYCNVIDIDKDNIEALFYRAYIYMQRRDYGGARQDYNALLLLEPGHSTARLGRALLNQKEGKFREALEDFTRLVTDHPRDVTYLKARARLEAEMGKSEVALLDLEDAAKIDPDDAEIYVLCGDIYLSQKRKREAYVAYEKAVSLGVPRPELQDKIKASK